MENVNDPMKTINNEREFNTAGLKSRISILLKQSQRKHKRSDYINDEFVPKKKQQIDIYNHNANILNKMTKANLLEYLNSINHTKEMDKTLHKLKLLKRSVEKTKMPLPSFDLSGCSNNKYIYNQNKTVSNKNSPHKFNCKYITRNKKVFDIIPINKIKEKGSCNFLPEVYTTNNNNTCPDDININNNEPQTIQTDITLNKKNSAKSQLKKLKLKRTKDNKILNINFLVDYQKDVSNSHYKNNNTIHTSNKENEQFKLSKSIYDKNIKNVKCKIRLTKNNFFGDTLQEFDDNRIAYQKNQRNKSRMLSTEFPTTLYNYNYLYSTNKANLNKAQSNIVSLEKSIFSHYDIMREQVNQAKPHYL